MSSHSSERRLPQFIHIASKMRGVKSNANTKANASHPPPSTPPPNTLYKTPTKGNKTAATTATPPATNSRRRIRGILKNPSYRFTGIRVKSSPKKNKNPNPSTPDTVGTNDSLDRDGNDSISRCSILSGSTVGSVSTFGTTSTEGIKKTIENIINDQISQNTGKTKTKDDALGCNEDDKTNHKTVIRQSSSSSASVSSTSTTSTTCSTTSATSKEELQRCARIKHIEDLKERISNAKARKLVERKAYRREDKLLLRLARQLKAVSKQSRENALNITILEESNQYCEECYNQTLQELEELKVSRRLLQERLLAENQKKLDEDQEHRNRIFRVQDAELEAHKRSHQFNCQALCESVLDANNNLDRMRALWEEHFGNEDTFSSKRNRGGTKVSRLSFFVAMVVVLAITTFVIRAATAGGANDTIEPIVDITDEQHLLLPPVHMIPNGIISNDETDTCIVTPSARTRITKTAEKNQACTIAEIENDVSIVEPKMNSLESFINSSQDTESSHTEANTDPLSTFETATTKQRGREKRRFRPKEVLSHLFRK